jgi:hypothetical protein
MKIYDFILNNSLPKDLRAFCDFSKDLKSKYKALDGFGLDYSKKGINSIKLYTKIYSRKLPAQEDCLKCFFGEQDFIINKTDIHNQSIQGINLSIKLNLNSLKTKKAIYLPDGKNSSKVITFNKGARTELKYRYFHNPLIIKLINFYFKLNMPKHKEGIEFSKRGKKAHCAIFPKFNHNNMTLKQSKNYCNKLKKIINPQLPDFIEEFETKECSFITQGYTSNSIISKTYFGLFDWEKSTFE